MMYKILYIHDEKRVKYGAQYINDLIVKKLRRENCIVDNIYPEEEMGDIPSVLKGIGNILFYYSLIQKKKDIYKYDIIQGTTYTPLAFLDAGVPVIAHFGSTTEGFLKSVPSLRQLGRESQKLVAILRDLKEHGVIPQIVPPIKSLKDISRIEIHVAKNSDLVVASSQQVKRELARAGVPRDRIKVIHNAIEDYWFRSKPRRSVKEVAELVYLGRMGDDPFTIKLKGIDRLAYIVRKFPELQKTIIGMCKKIAEHSQFFSQFPNTVALLSIEKRYIPRILRHHYGDLYVNPGRYEGFCLSLVEAMSQGLVPVVFPIGVAPEIIDNGRNGYLVRSLGETVRRIRYLSHRPKVRARMAEEAMKTSRQFRTDILIRKYLATYKKLIEGAPRGTRGARRPFLSFRFRADRPAPHPRLP